MTDRELVELAAKAVGIRLHIWGTEGSENFSDIDKGKFGTRWNPLKDDGDAFRLAVQLQIDVNHQRALGVVEAFWSKDAGCKREPYGSDSLAATRRAIVRAAAAIGESK
ncbi:hypothetical protein LMG7141_00843 [Ralstonia condita]|uniref:Uncharacterized protein n=1 Tax=Ralstonia condita TaxID=3058600 RepID=A0ABM9J190_9RALS|nr:hypothetical protein [Ralstonia sp. LMG 7141]CAJ0779130.1 hypothetical protein LMG7141_00843 [Ralstonia sp. LMG 7141]